MGGMAYSKACGKACGVKWHDVANCNGDIRYPVYRTYLRLCEVVRYLSLRARAVSFRAVGADQLAWVCARVHARVRECVQGKVKANSNSLQGRGACNIVSGRNIV